MLASLWVHLAFFRQHQILSHRYFQSLQGSCLIEASEILLQIDQVSLQQILRWLQTDLNLQFHCL